MDVKNLTAKWVSHLNLNLFDEFIQPWVTSKRGQQLGIAFFYLLLLINLWILFLAVKNWRIDHAPSVARVVLTTTKNTQAEAFNDLMQAHLFGLALNHDELPITSMQLHLTGIMQNADSHLSQAIISSQGGPGIVYKVGDMLPSGMKVYSITKQEVILQRHNHLEKLPLIRQPLIFQGLPTPMN